MLILLFIAVFKCHLSFKGPISWGSLSDVCGVLDSNTAAAISAKYNLFATENMAGLDFTSEVKVKVRGQICS